MRGRLMEGLEPVSLCCASGVFTKDLEDALFDMIYGYAPPTSNVTPSGIT